MFGKKSDDIIGDQSSVNCLNFLHLNQKDFEKAGYLLDDEMSISYSGGYYVEGREAVIETFRKSHSNNIPIEVESATKNIKSKNDNRVVNVFDVMEKRGSKIDVYNMMLATYVKDGKIKGKKWVHSRTFNPQEYKALFSDAKSGKFIK